MKKRKFKLETRNRQIGTSFFNDRGISLIEVLVSATIFVISMLGILGMMFNSMHGAKFGNQNQVATALATDQVESLMTLPVEIEVAGEIVANPVLAEGVHDDANNPIDESGGTGGVYTRSYEVTDHLSHDLALLDSKMITVTVAWNDGWGIGREVRMDYLYYVTKKPN